MNEQVTRRAIGLVRGRQLSTCLTQFDTVACRRPQGHSKWHCLRTLKTLRYGRPRSLRPLVRPLIESDCDESSIPHYRRKNDPSDGH
jgi:hypothetical protein